MRIYLDLLPQQRKQEIKRKKLFNKILREEFLFLLPLVVLIFILLGIYHILTLQKDSKVVTYSAQQSQEKYQQLKKYEDKFKQVNILSETVEKIAAKHLYWQEFLKKLSGATPEGIYISDLSTKDFTVFLVGKAKTRENLLELKNRLESTSCFSNVNVPLSNLVVKENVDFQVDITINEDCLKK